MKRHAATILLALVACGLVLFLFLDRDRVTDTERAKREGSVFAAFRADALSRIELAKGDETIVIERDAQKDAPWRMVSPRVDKADQSAVERLVIALEFAQEVRKATPGPELGLDEPRLRGAVTMGGLVVRFVLGRESPRPEGSAYLRVEGGAPIVVSKDFADVLLQHSDAYRDRTVVPYLSLDLARFSSKPKDGPGFILEHTEGRAFKVVGPDVRASRAALDRVWGSLAELRAETFPKGADPEKLVGEPMVVVVMTPKDTSKPEAELALGGSCPGHPADLVVVRRRPSPVVACAPRTVLPALRADPASMLDHGLFTFHADETEELRLERIGAADAGAAPSVIELARRGAGFHLREPTDRDLSPEEADAANDLLTGLAALTGARVTAKASLAPFTPALRLTARSGERQQVIEIEDAGPDGARARRREDGAELLLSRRDALLVSPRVTSIMPRRAVRDTRGVKRVIARCGVPQELVDDGAGFSLVSPKGYDVDASSVGQLVDALTRGKIDRWLADADDGTFGIDPTDKGCHVTLGFDGGATVTVRLSAPGPEGVYGSVSDGGHVFVAPASFRALAETIFVSRAYLRVDPERVSRVTLQRGLGVFGTQGPSDALKDALGGLLADRVVALGPGAGPPLYARVEVGLAGDGGAREHVVTIGEPDGGVSLARVRGVDATFAVTERALDRVFAASPLGPADAGAAPIDGGAAPTGAGPLDAGGRP